jgi:hypothetical protein
MASKCLWIAVLVCAGSCAGWAQLTDRTLAPNTANVGIAKSLQDETGTGRGDMMTWNSSVFIIDPIPFDRSVVDASFFSGSSPVLMAKAKMKEMVRGTSIRIMRLGPDSPTVVRCATDDPRVRQALAA